MNVPNPDCPSCRVRMEEGFVADRGDNNRAHRVVWTEGRPEKSLLQGVKVKGRRSIETMCLRCPRCGWLIWFAPEVEDSDGV